MGFEGCLLLLSPPAKEEYFRPTRKGGGCWKAHASSIKALPQKIPKPLILLSPSQVGPSTASIDAPIAQFFDSIGNLFFPLVNFLNSLAALTASLPIFLTPSGK